MVICKQPEIGAAVQPHQDSTFLYTDPPSAVGWWYALEDATKENGCLSFAAGSHKRTPIKRRFVRTSNGSEAGTEFIDNDGTQFPTSLQPKQNGGTAPGTPRSHLHQTSEGSNSNGAQEEHEEKREEVYEIGEVKAGTLVLIHGNILHKSERNTSKKSRFIYTFHVIEGKEKYDERNWLQPPEAGFSKLETVLAA